jgi:lysophospholipase L1-like esterase
MKSNSLLYVLTFCFTGTALIGANAPPTGRALTEMLPGQREVASVTEIPASTGEKETIEDSTRIIVVLGSSTAAGTGASTPDSSWVGRFRSYVKHEDSTASVINLAVGGYTTYDIMPTGFTPPAGRPTPKVTHNVTYGLTFKPRVIIINLPSNDVAYGYSIAEQLANYDTIMSRIPPSVTVWVSTTQPRNLDATGRANLIAMRDSTFARFTTHALDFWTTLANTDGSINPVYGAGDGIHLNNAGHRILFERVVAAGVWSDLLSVGERDGDLPDAFSLEQNFPNPFNPTTVVNYQLAVVSDVRLVVYDILGRKVAMLVNGRKQPGMHNVRFDGSQLGSGVYFYRLTAGSYVSCRKMLLLK